MSGVIPIVKLAVHVASTIGVSKVVTDFVRNNTNVVTTADAVKVWTGGIVLGAMAAEAATKTVDRQWDSLAKLTTGLTKKTEEVVEEVVEEVKPKAKS